MFFQLFSNAVTKSQILVMYGSQEIILSFLSLTFLGCQFSETIIFDISFCYVINQFFSLIVYFTVSLRNV